MPFCPTCRRHFFYPRTICPHCHSPEVGWRRASGRGRIASYVISHRAIPGVRDHAPFVIALVELDEGVRLMSILIDVEPDPAHVHLGQSVEVDFELRGEQHVPVFRPAVAR